MMALTKVSELLLQIISVYRHYKSVQIIKREGDIDEWTSAEKYICETVVLEVRNTIPEKKWK